MDSYLDPNNRCSKNGANSQHRRTSSVRGASKECISGMLRDRDLIEQLLKKVMTIGGGLRKEWFTETCPR